MAKKAFYRISSYLYCDFYIALRSTFLTEWSSEGAAPEVDPSFWYIPIKVKGKDTDIFSMKFGRHYEFFYRLNLVAKRLKEEEGKSIMSNVSYVEVSKTPFDKALNYLDCDGDNYSEKLKKLYNNDKISDIAKAKQDSIFVEFAANLPKHSTKHSTERINKQIDKEVAIQPALDDIKHTVENRVISNNSMRSKARHLSNSSWWLYYSNDSTDDFNGDEHWFLFRAIFHFLDYNASKMKVTIDNNIDEGHVDYEGEIDFEHSSATVLVINLNYRDEGGRQLNIKVNVGKGTGKLFLGQYLNYDEEGNIFSGNLVFQQINKKKSKNIKPKLFRIKNNQTSEKYPKEIGFLIPFFIDVKNNFHRTPTKIHSVKRFSELLQKKKAI